MTKFNTFQPFPSTEMLDSFLPSTLGFDRVFDLLDHVTDTVNSSNLAFPPVNVVKVSEHSYAVEMAVAGFKKEEIDVTVEKNNLTISGKKAEKDEREYLVKGIAGRSFSRTFVVLDTIVVKEASLKDGILSVHLENVVPDATKANKIVIK
jgi:molecular chaperone IbpA